jgi:hypothetical protein
VLSHRVYETRDIGLTSRPYNRKWYPGFESNKRPLPYQRSILPLNYPDTKMVDRIGFGPMTPRCKRGVFPVSTNSPQKIGSAVGIRTRVTSLKGKQTWPLSDIATEIGTRGRNRTDATSVRGTRSTTRLHGHLKLLVNCSGVEPLSSPYKEAILPLNEQSTVNLVVNQGFEPRTSSV